MNTVDIKDMTVDQLKVLAYDESIVFKRANNNLILLEQAIEAKLRLTAANTGVQDTQSQK